MLSATLTCLDPIFKKLMEDEDQAHSGQSFLVPVDVKDNLWEWFNHLQELTENFDSIDCTLHEKEFRHLKGALKCIGKVSFKGLSSRLLEICIELDSLKITLP